jgi:hypothetical protein
MSQCLYGIRGTVTDLESGDPVRARIFVENHDSLYSAVHSSPDHGDFYRLIKEGVYDLVVSAPGYRNDTIRSLSVTDYRATLLDVQLEARGLGTGDREAPGFNIYPNPAVNRIMVEAEHLPHGTLELTAYNLEGKMMLRQTVYYQGSGIELSTGQLEPGIYLLHCSMEHYSQVLPLVVFKP